MIVDMVNDLTPLMYLKKNAYELYCIWKTNCYGNNIIQNKPNIKVKSEVLKNLMQVIAFKDIHNITFYKFVDLREFLKSSYIIKKKMFAEFIQRKNGKLNMNPNGLLNYHSSVNGAIPPP